MRTEESNIATSLKMLLPSTDQTEQACERVSQRLRSGSALEEEIPGDELFRTAFRFSWWRMVAATAAGLALLLVSVAVFRSTPNGGISRSGGASEYLARLFGHSSETTRVTGVQNPAYSGAVFEVASVRPGEPSRGGGRGFGPQSCGGDIRVEPRLFVARDVTLYRLIAVAYGKDCIFLEQNGELLRGGPEWMRSDGFVILARMPQGSPEYSQSQMDAGNALKLQEMIRNLLVERFKLTLHSEMKDIPVYLLTRSKGAPRVIASKEGDPLRGFVGMAGRGEQRSFHIIGGKKSMADLARQLQDATRQTVLDRTGITGEFNYDIQYAPAGNQVGAETDGLSGPSLFTALEEQLGLKLESTRAPVQSLVIDGAQKPSEN